MSQPQIHPAAEMLPLLPGPELETLAQSIRAHGLKHPIVLLDGAVIDGRNRLLACERAGVEPRFVDWTPANGESPWDYVWSTNAERRHLEAGTKAALGVKFETASEEWREERRRAEERKRRALEEATNRRVEAAKAKGTRADVPAPAPERPTPPPAARRDKRAEEARESRTHLAKKIGVSPRTVQDAISLQKKAPETFERVARGEVPLKKALAEVKRQERVERIVEIAKGNAPLASDRRFPVIYADPPWRYDNTAGASAAEDHYPTMSLEEICALDVPATPDAVLFLWATSPLLPEAFDVIDAWGFTYKGSMVWSKGSGTGNWVLNAHEILMIATRGDIPCPLPANRPMSVITAPRTRHSAKPPEFAEAIERMVPDLPKIELFCRTPRDGWVAWGNEAAA